MLINRTEAVIIESMADHAIHSIDIDIGNEQHRVAAGEARTRLDHLKHRRDQFADMRRRAAKVRKSPLTAEERSQIAIVRKLVPDVRGSQIDDLIYGRTTIFELVGERKSA